MEQPSKAIQHTRQGTTLFPEADSQCNHQINFIDRDRWDHMINCLIEGMKKLTVKPVNYEKVKEVQQGQDENPEVFQRRFSSVQSLSHVRLFATP